MHFLYPKVLWALTAIAFPIIIHLFNFRKYTTVYFSNVAFLKNIQKESKSKSVLRNLLVLLLRCLAIVFVVFAFARPYIPADKNKQSPKESNAIVYIDNSFSMDADGKYGILLETAKLKARELATLLPRNTKYLLLTNDFKTMHQRYVGSDQFIEWVSQIQSTHVVRNLNEVVLKASALMSPDSTILNQLYVFSDFQQNVLDEFNGEQLKNLNIVAIQVQGNPVGNLFIDSVWLQSPGHYKGKEEKLMVNIVNESDVDHNDIPLTFYVNDSIRSTLVFDIEAQKETQIEVPFTIWQSGYVYASVEITDYPITYDNSFYFSFEISERKKVLIVNGIDNEKYFEALFANDENIISESVSENEIPYNRLNNYEVVILNQLENLSTGLINEFVGFTKKGGSALLIPSANANLQTYQMLFNEFRLTIAEPIEQNGVLSNFDLKNRLFASTIESELKNARFPEYQSYYPIRNYTNEISDVLFYSESGDPLFIKKLLGEGEVYISALPLNIKNTGLALHPLFVPLMYNIALYSSKPSDLYYWIRPGMYAKTKALSNTFAPVLENKHNKNQLMPKYSLIDNYVYMHTDINKLQDGHYSVGFNNDFSSGLSFNYDRQESVMEFSTIDEIEEIIATVEKGKTNVLALSKNELEQHVVLNAMGKSLSNLFLWMLAFVVLLEMFVLRYIK